MNLGWQPRDVDQAIAALEEEGVIGADGEEVNVATVLRAALRKLSKHAAVMTEDEALRQAEEAELAARRARQGDEREGWYPRWRTRTSGSSRARCGPSGSPSSPARPGCASSCR